MSRRTHQPKPTDAGSIRPSHGGRAASHGPCFAPSRGLRTAKPEPSRRKSRTTCMPSFERTDHARGAGAGFPERDGTPVAACAAWFFRDRRRGGDCMIRCTSTLGTWPAPPRGRFAAVSASAPRGPAVAWQMAALTCPGTIQKTCRVTTPNREPPAWRSARHDSGSSERMLDLSALPAEIECSAEAVMP